MPIPPCLRLAQREVQTGWAPCAADAELDLGIGGGVIREPEVDLVESGELGGGSGVADTLVGDWCSVEEDLELGTVEERSGRAGHLAIGSIGDGGAESGGVEDDIHSWGGGGGVADERSVEAGGDDGFGVEGEQTRGEGNEAAVDFRPGFSIEGDENPDTRFILEDAGHEEVDLGWGDIPDGSGEAVDEDSDSSSGKDSWEKTAIEVTRCNGAFRVGEILAVDGCKRVGSEDGKPRGGMYDGGGRVLGSEALTAAEGEREEDPREHNKRRWALRAHLLRASV